MTREIADASILVSVGWSPRTADAGGECLSNTRHWSGGVGGCTIRILGWVRAGPSPGTDVKAKPSVAPHAYVLVLVLTEGLSVSFDPQAQMEDFARIVIGKR